MSRFIEGEARSQSLLFPERLEDWIAEDNPVRVVDAFVDELDLMQLGFDGADPASTGRSGYHPTVLLKIYIRRFPRAGPPSSVLAGSLLRSSAERAFAEMARER